jgi:hypothetical protein
MVSEGLKKSGHGFQVPAYPCLNCNPPACPRPTCRRSLNGSLADDAILENREPLKTTALHFHSSSKKTVPKHAKGWGERLRSRLGSHVRTVIFSGVRASFYAAHASNGIIRCMKLCHKERSQREAKHIIPRYAARRIFWPQEPRHGDFRSSARTHGTYQL